MATKKQIAASRRNAKKSTGPRTSGGKAVSRLNALRHGLRARLEFSSAEGRRDLLEIRARLMQAWQPQTLGQRRLVARAACAEWKLLEWRAGHARLLRDAAETSSPSRQDRLRAGFSRRQARLEGDLRDAYDELNGSIRMHSPESCPPA